MGNLSSVLFDSAQDQHGEHNIVNILNDDIPIRRNSLLQSVSDTSLQLRQLKNDEILNCASDSSGSIHNMDFKGAIFDTDPIKSRGKDFQSIGDICSPRKAKNNNYQEDVFTSLSNNSMYSMDNSLLNSECDDSNLQTLNKPFSEELLDVLKNLPVSRDCNLYQVRNQPLISVLSQETFHVTTDETDSGEITPVSLTASSEFEFKVELSDNRDDTNEVSNSTLVPKASPVENTIDESSSSDCQPTTSLQWRVDSICMLERKTKYFPQNQLVGEWISKSNEAMAAKPHNYEVKLDSEVDVPDDDDKTITSSMTSTSPARKTIFQVFGSPLSHESCFIKTVPEIDEKDHSREDIPTDETSKEWENKNALGFEKSETSCSLSDEGLHTDSQQISYSLFSAAKLGTSTSDHTCSDNVILELSDKANASSECTSTGIATDSNSEPETCIASSERNTTEQQLGMCLSPFSVQTPPSVICSMMKNESNQTSTSETNCFSEQSNAIEVTCPPQQFSSSSSSPEASDSCEFYTPLTQELKALTLVQIDEIQSPPISDTVSSPEESKSFESASSGTKTSLKE